MLEPDQLRRQAKLAALRTDFAAALPERLATLAACWRTAESAQTWGDAHAELLRLSHSLAGSAGTFGYRRLGEAARELEEMLVLLSQVDRAPLASRIAGLVGLMCELAEAEADEGLDASSTSVHNDNLPKNNRNVILIEDDYMLAQELAAQLGMFGWEVDILTNATDARTALAGLCPSAVIIDVMLPEGPLAGLELMQQVQAEGSVVVPHVVMSNRNDWESRLAAVHSGAAAYLVKPIDIAALEEQLERITSYSRPEPYRVLVVDDDRLLAEHYVQVLTAAGMDVLAITSPCGLLGAITEHQPEIVLMDLYMPECTGIEALQVIRQDSQFDSLPVVFLSAESSSSQQQSAMRTGAEDFLQKPISDANLIMAVSIRTERFRSLTKLIRQDSLTGLLNHISFKLRLENEVDRNRRLHEPLSLALLDIDFFKRVNDTYGHSQGDRVIKSLAQLLRKRLRKSDIIGRYGGEEFVVAMPNTLPSLAVTILDELRENFSKLRFTTPQGEFFCTFSCGVTASPPMENSKNLINLADEALYQVKHSGRNKVGLLIKTGQSIFD